MNILINIILYYILCSHHFDIATPFKRCNFFLNCIFGIEYLDCSNFLNILHLLMSIVRTYLNIVVSKQFVKATPS